MSEDYRFDDNLDFVARYDEGPPLFVPGYHASHVMAASILLERIGAAGNLLIVGAGGGVEIAAFARFAPGWCYCAVDPSDAMLDLVAARLARFDPAPEVSLVQGVSSDAPDGPFDAATAFLCLPFVPDDGMRLAQLRAIHARLKPGAPFLMVHAVSAPERWEPDLSRFATHARLSGADEALVATALAMQREHLHVLTEEREAALLREAGFRLDGIFYQGLWIRGWEATA
jgi:tRNA (cmo5U34)-methyltransferase